MGYCHAQKCKAKEKAQVKVAAKFNKRLAQLLFRCIALVQKYCTTLKSVGPQAVASHCRNSAPNFCRGFQIITPES